jgi:hypothetical protein
MGVSEESANKKRASIGSVYVLCNQGQHDSDACGTGTVCTVCLE